MPSASPLSPTAAVDGTTTALEIDKALGTAATGMTAAAHLLHETIAAGGLRGYKAAANAFWKYATRLQNPPLAAARLGDGAADAEEFRHAEHCIAKLAEQVWEGRRSIHFALDEHQVSASIFSPSETVAAAALLWHSARVAKLLHQSEDSTLLAPCLEQIVGALVRASRGWTWSTATAQSGPKVPSEGEAGATAWSAALTCLQLLYKDFGTTLETEFRRFRSALSRFTPPGEAAAQRTFLLEASEAYDAALRTT